MEKDESHEIIFNKNNQNNKFEFDRYTIDLFVDSDDQNLKMNFSYLDEIFSNQDLQIFIGGNIQKYDGINDKQYNFEQHLSSQQKQFICNFKIPSANIIDENILITFNIFLILNEIQSIDVFNIPTQGPILNSIIPEIDNDEFSFKPTGLSAQPEHIYINSILQVLFNLTIIRRLIYEIGQEFSYEESNDFISNLQQLFLSMQKQPQIIHSASDIVQSFSSISNNPILSELPIQEYFRNFLKMIMLSMTSYQKNQLLSLIHLNNLFQGLFNDEEKNENEISFDLTLSVKEYQDLDSVLSAISNVFYQNSQLTNEDMIPSIFFLFLNRNEINESANQVQFLNNRFIFKSSFLLPLVFGSEITILNFQENQSKYTLIGIINHEGDFRIGNYYTYFKLENEDKWYKYSDSNVSLISNSEVFESSFENAVLLIYIKEFEKENLLFNENIEIPENLLKYSMKKDEEKKRKEEYEEKLKSSRKVILIDLERLKINARFNSPTFIEPDDIFYDKFSSDQNIITLFSYQTIKDIYTTVEEFKLQNSLDENNSSWKEGVSIFMIQNEDISDVLLPSNNIINDMVVKDYFYVVPKFDFNTNILVIIYFYASSYLSPIKVEQIVVPKKITFKDLQSSIENDIQIKATSSFYFKHGNNFTQINDQAMQTSLIQYQRDGIVLALDLPLTFFNTAIFSNDNLLNQSVFDQDDEDDEYLDFKYSTQLMTLLKQIEPTLSTQISYFQIFPEKKPKTINEYLQLKEFVFWASSIETGQTFHVSFPIELSGQEIFHTILLIFKYLNKNDKNDHIKLLSTFSQEHLTKNSHYDQNQEIYITSNSLFYYNLNPQPLIINNDLCFYQYNQGIKLLRFISLGSISNLSHNYLYLFNVQKAHVLMSKNQTVKDLIEHFRSLYKTNELPLEESKVNPILGSFSDFSNLHSVFEFEDHHSDQYSVFLTKVDDENKLEIYDQNQILEAVKPDLYLIPIKNQNSHPYYIEFICENFPIPCNRVLAFHSDETLDDLLNEAVSEWHFNKIDLINNFSFYLCNHNCSSKTLLSLDQVFSKKLCSNNQYIKLISNKN